ncbi:putative fungal-specific transcription factor [Mycena maculata]|uniref:Fungal-specific transcription factor n=1 Tax=Mycena maculata TaxID=230809 RepID=A0AAD7JZP6_9AGAR|nr:putative fungal-specific transcription factor [Mycena maculata]
MFSEMILDYNREGTSEPSRRQRRIQGACDVCKKRKIRCDSGEMPGNRCTHCINSGLDCTHADLMKTLSSAKGYVAALESRVEKMERLLNKLLPGIDFTEQLENESNIESLLPHTETLPRNDTDGLTGALNKLKLNPEQSRFFGRSSGIQLVQTALNFKTRVIGLSQPPYPILPNRRPQFWEPPPWLLPTDGDAPQYTFPDPDLLPVLVNLYFKEVNCFSPLLHRPTFDRKVAAKLHLIDHRFAATLLMVCSLGARYSDDPRTLLDGESVSHSAGWKWYTQVRVIPKHLLYKPDLYELQTIALSAIYFQALSPTAVGWNQIGFGLRRAQDVGAHRRRIDTHPTAENEQWKRVFWVLVCLEWLYGTHTGRPVLMHDQDYDQDLPIECDDEYWDLPEPHNFKQPKDKPSALAYFNHRIRLLEIQAAVASTLYSPRKPSHFSGQPSPSTDSQTIIAFDSALNAWLSEVPDHLRWDPARKNRLHFSQSALLYAEYYNVQILLHRPFIPSPFDIPPPGALPSLAICTNAARSSARIFDAQEKRGITLHDMMLPTVFAVAVVLLLNAWSDRRPASNSTKELDHVYTCLKVTMDAEHRFLGAGRYSDILNRLIHAGANVESLFHDINSFSSVPLWAQPSHGFNSNAELSAEWSSTFTRHHVKDFEAAADTLNATLRSRPHNVNVHRCPEGGAVQFPGVPGAYAQPTSGYNFQQFMDAELSPFAEADMSIDPNIMSMWCAAPATFQYVPAWPEYCFVLD